MEQPMNQSSSKMTKNGTQRMVQPMNLRKLVLLPWCANAACVPRDGGKTGTSVAEPTKVHTFQPLGVVLLRLVQAPPRMPFL